jgi:hypothetical protein
MADINRLKVVSVERYGKKNPVIRKNRRMEENKMIIYTSIDGQTKLMSDWKMKPYGLHKRRCVNCIRPVNRMSASISSISLKRVN